VAEPITATALALPKLHNSEPYVLFEGTAGAGQLFTTVVLTGAECPLSKNNDLKGSVVAQIDDNNTVEPLLLFDHTIQKLFQTTATLGDHLKFGNLEAYIDADLKAKLTGSHIGLTLGVC
jgi:hypothetical protein